MSARFQIQQGRNPMQAPFQFKRAETNRNSESQTDFPIREKETGSAKDGISPFATVSAEERNLIDPCHVRFHWRTDNRWCRRPTVLRTSRRFCRPSHGQ